MKKLLALLLLAFLVINCSADNDSNDDIFRVIDQESIHNEEQQTPIVDQGSNAELFISFENLIVPINTINFSQLPVEIIVENPLDKIIIGFEGLAENDYSIEREFTFDRITLNTSIAETVNDNLVLTPIFGTPEGLVNVSIDSDIVHNIEMYYWNDEFGGTLF